MPPRDDDDFALSVAPSSPDQQLRTLITAFGASRALYTAARFGIIDTIMEGDQKPEVLAESKHLDLRTLKMLLVALESLGLLTVGEDGYVVTEVGEYLSRHHPATVHWLALTCGGEMSAAWDQLPAALETGACAFEIAHGLPLHDFMRHDGSARLAYHSALAVDSRLIGEDLATWDIWSGRTSVADLGASSGALLQPILQTHSALWGTFVDLPEIVAQANSEDLSKSLGQRLKPLAADIMTALPIEAEVAVLCRVLFNWPEDTAAQILEVALRAVGRRGEVVIVEPMQSSRTPRHYGLTDLHLFVQCHGRTRRPKDYQRLARALSAEVVSVRPIQAVPGMIALRLVAS